jgi:hypothetical protein
MRRNFLTQKERTPFGVKGLGEEQSGLAVSLAV